MNSYIFLCYKLYTLCVFIFQLMAAFTELLAPNFSTSVPDCMAVRQERLKSLEVSIKSNMLEKNVILKQKADLVMKCSSDVLRSRTVSAYITKTVLSDKSAR